MKGRATVQRDLERLEKWAERNLKKFNGKRTALPLGWSHPLQQNRLETTGKQAALQERTRKPGWTSNLAVSSAPVQRRPAANGSAASRAGSRVSAQHL